MPAATTSLFIDKYHPKQPKKKIKSSNFLKQKGSKPENITKKKKTNGLCAVSIRVTFDRIKRYYPTGISLTFSDFKKTQGEKPRKEFKDLALELQDFERKAADIIKNLPVFTFTAFEKQYKTNRGTKDSIKAAFESYAVALRKEGRISTAVSHECARASLNNFAPDAKFFDITPEFLRKYEKWMLTEKKIGNKKVLRSNSITTVGIYLRALRTLFNNAIADGLLTKDYYPFGKKRYEIPTGSNVKKALLLKDLGKIFHYEPEPGSTADRMKDYWIFMYLCNGINVKDMCLLKYSNIKGDVLEFERAKTIRTKRKIEPIRVTLTDDMNAIVKKWGNNRKDGNIVVLNSFIFDILEHGLTPEETYKRIKQITHLINDHMRIIAKILQISSDLTTYVARHSFATTMLRSGANTQYIMEALGHTNEITTQKYLGGFEDKTKKEWAAALTAFNE